MDLADRISRGVVAALDLAPLDARFGELSRQVLQGGASRFAAVVDPTEPLDLVVPVGVPEASVNFGALVLQRSRVGLLWRDAHHGDRTALVALDADTRATWAPVTLGNEEWTRFVVDDRHTRMVFLTPPTATTALRRAVAHLVRATEEPGQPVLEEGLEDLPDTAVLPAVTDAPPPDASPTVLAPAVAVAAGLGVPELPGVEEPESPEQAAVEEPGVDEPTLEQPSIPAPAVDAPAAAEPPGGPEPTTFAQSAGEDAPSAEFGGEQEGSEGPADEALAPAPADKDSTVAFPTHAADEWFAEEGQSPETHVPQTGSDLPVSATLAAAAVLPPEPVAVVPPPTAPAPWQPAPAWEQRPTPPTWQPPSPAATWQQPTAPWQPSGAPALYRDEPRIPQQQPWQPAPAPNGPPPAPVPAVPTSTGASVTLVGFLAGLSITLLVGGIALVLLLLG